MMKIIFFGSDDFARVHLEAVIAAGHKVVACVTQPDKPKGRGLQVVISPIKEVALQHKTPVLQPESLKDSAFQSQLKSFDADLFVVIAYGKILPAEVIEIAKTAAINVHGSMLPQYRGAAPINWAIINGKRETGLTIMKINPKMDAGEIILQEKIKIEDLDTSVTLRQKMMNLGSELLIKVLSSIEKKSYTLKAQDESKSTYAAKLTKELGKIDWKKSAVEIHNLVRGLLPWPSAYTSFKGKLLKILSSEVVLQDVLAGIPGEILQINPRGFVVKAGKDALLVSQVHLEAGKQMSAKDFLSGHRLEVGFLFA